MTTKKQTKAEIIFNQTMTEIRISIEHHGIGSFDLTSIYTENTDGLVCQRTINAMNKLLAREENRVNHYIKYLGMDASMEVATEAIRIMRNTIAAAQRDYVDYFKNI